MCLYVCLCVGMCMWGCRSSAPLKLGLPNVSAGTWILFRRGRSSESRSHFPSPKSASLFVKVAPALEVTLPMKWLPGCLQGLDTPIGHQHKAGAAGTAGQGPRSSGAVQGGRNPSLRGSQNFRLCPPHMLGYNVPRQPPAGV